MEFHREVIGDATLYLGDCREVLKTLPDCSVHCCVSSPPYFGLRDYGHANQIGLEPTPDEYVAKLVEVFCEVRRVLRDDGTLWLNLGDSYAGSWGAQSRGNTTGEDKATITGKSMLSARQIKAHPQGRTGTGSLKNTPGLKPKDLIGIPWRVAFALQADGWYLRQDIIWAKPNPMPESVTDRCTKSHEYIFLLSKSERYHFDSEAIAEPLAASSIDRLSQPNLDGQHGSDRVSGKTNGPMKAVARSGNKERKQRPNADTLHRGAQAGSIPWEGSARNKRSVWTVTTKAFSGAHFATFPPDLIEPCILAGCPVDGTVLDPFGGSGTAGMVAIMKKRKTILIELNHEYGAMITERICDVEGHNTLFDPKLMSAADLFTELEAAS